MIVGHAADTAWVDSGERVVVLRLDRLADHPLVLEGSAAVVWRLLSEGPTVAALVEAVAAEYAVTPADVEADVLRFLDSAERLGAVAQGGAE